MCLPHTRVPLLLLSLHRKLNKRTMMRLIQHERVLGGEAGGAGSAMCCRARRRRWEEDWEEGSVLTTSPPPLGRHRLGQAVQLLWRWGLMR